VKFTKMHGIGNDFVLIDELRDGPLSGDHSVLSQRICDRKFGVGADGLILVQRDPELRMRMFNPDGSESEMCGNGLRTFAKLVFDRGHVTEPNFPIQTGAGTLHVELIDSEVRVDMGEAKLKPADIGMSNEDDSFINQPIAGSIKGTAVSMGNPHLVIFVTDLEKIDLDLDGPPLERHPFFLNRTNVHFAQVIDREHLKMKTWERGAGATLACGTGACATAVAASLNDHTGRQTEITLPGGKLTLEYKETGHVFMTGPAEYVFEGELSSLL
jgi:diaminopimelate epimerase